MNDQLMLQTLLRKKLSELQARNPSFSVRAFASRLGLQPSATNELLKGERRASRKLAEKIAAKLLLDPTERQDLLKHFPQKKKKAGGRLGSANSDSVGGFIHEAGIGTGGQDSVGSNILKLTADQFQLISDGLHYALLSLVRTKSFQNNSVWIAKRLKTTVPKVEAAINRLTRLGFLEHTPAGLKRTYSRLHTSDDIFNISIQKSHLGDMEIAREALANVPIELRDFSSFTMPANPKLLPKAKEILRRAQDEIAELLAQESPDEVYRLSTYLYPLTQIPLNTNGTKK